MGQTLFQNDKYKIRQNGRGYVLINLKGDYENHGHFKKKDTCFLMIKLIDRKIIPERPYLKEAALRISCDEKYKAEIENEIAKQRNKQYYININKGVKKNG